MKLYLVRVRWGDLPARRRPVCAAGALANLDLLVLLDQAKRTEKKEKRYNCENQARFHLINSSKNKAQDAEFLHFPFFWRLDFPNCI